MKIRYFIAETVEVTARKLAMLEFSFWGKTRSVVLRNLIAWCIVCLVSYIAGSCFVDWFAGKQVEPWLVIGLCLAVVFAVTPEST